MKHLGSDNSSSSDKIIKHASRCCDLPFNRIFMDGTDLSATQKFRTMFESSTRSPFRVSHSFFNILWSGRKDLNLMICQTGFRISAKLHLFSVVNATIINIHMCCSMYMFLNVSMLMRKREKKRESESEREREREREREERERYLYLHDSS